jgi:glycine/D-amino acid oxidase-like deaminating enzyme
MSRYSLDFYKNFEKEMAVDGETPQIDFKQNGYLYLGTSETMPRLAEEANFQNRCGANMSVLSADDIKKIVPELNTRDLAGATFDNDAGYMDPYTVLQFFAKKAKSLDVEYIYAPVQAILSESGKVTGVRLESGEEYHAPVVVNACGAWAGRLSKTVGIDIPVQPFRYQVFCLDLTNKFSKPLPLVFDPTGFYFRGEGTKVITGMPHSDPYSFEFSTEKSRFEDEVWPIFYERSELFGQLKVERSWTGLYDFNTKDQNAIIGGHPEMKGYYVITGFSGHGFQQAPAAGKGLSELIRLGKYETIDLSPLSVERFAKNELILETAIH